MWFGIGRHHPCRILEFQDCTRVISLRQLRLGSFQVISPFGLGRTVAAGPKNQSRESPDPHLQTIDFAHALPFGRETNSCSSSTIHLTQSGLNTVQLRGASTRTEAIPVSWCRLAARTTCASRRAVFVRPDYRSAAGL